jgi:outer membrane protein assembly factor BamE (lipoprotein component of BamABCDE complex)
MRSTRQSRCAAVVALLLALCGASAGARAQADEADVAALRAQFDQIRTLVEQFDQRLKALEARHSASVHAVSDAPPTAVAIAATGANASLAEPTSVVATPSPPTTTTRVDAPTPPAATAAAPDRHAWRQVTSGATQADVARLLGQPTKAFQLAGKTVWYYYYPAKAAGSVFFDAAGRSSSVQSPSSGW